MRNDVIYEPLGKTETPYWSSFELKNGLQLGDEGVYHCTSVNGSDSVEVHLAGKVSILIFSKHYSSTCKKMQLEYFALLDRICSSIILIIRGLASITVKPDLHNDHL